jgi:pre-mRNA branch site protein p14
MAAPRPTVRTLHLCISEVVFTVVHQSKLPPGANRILFVKNLNYQITGEDLYDLFGRYGSIRQIRIGNEPKSKGTAFVVFDDVMDVSIQFAYLGGLL